ncbi:flagellar biosynthesis protein FlhA [Castellaniella sp.]|uniref:flagellar biosynthesis protein FlhA n=1 Tax=Castellaniella sp. TaxID=1955812 RepID=UPI00355D8F14
MMSLIRSMNTLGLGSARMLAGPILILMVLAMMILPLPVLVLDLFFTFNISLAVMILLMAMFTRKALDFAAFPSVLLFATLLRLSLNVASTRIILLNGHNGPSAAGRVIEAFGQFLVGGNFAVGVIVFIILVIINFVVITKGAGRIAEVGARFTLDAMPGKQMAIDADLNAGLINEDEARSRRREIAQEAEFYGAMDGASKFVRGDAVAGLLIMVVNIVGGLIVGVVQRHLSVGDAASIYTLLTIGDGLVAQIPALVISTAAGVVVSRVATEEDVGEQVVSQLFSNPSVMFLTAGILALMGLIPNMPHVAFLLLALVLAGAGWSLLQRQRRALQAEAQAGPAGQPVDAAATEANWDDVQTLDTLSLEVGYRLIPLVDVHQSGELLQRIRSLRKKFAQEVGFLPPVVHIRDNLEIPPNAYRILLLGVSVAEGEAHEGQWLAIDPGGCTETLPGTPTKDPAFGLPATWIAAQHTEQAQLAGYTVVDAPTVVATHLNHLMRVHSADLLGRQETQALLERVARDYPKLTEELVPRILSLAQVQELLRGLLKEDVSIRDMRSILETMTSHTEPAGTQNGSAPEPDLGRLLARLRMALGRSIVQQWFGDAKELRVIGLDHRLEQILLQTLGNEAGLEPGLAENLLREAQRATQAQEAQGDAPVLLVVPALRVALARFLRLQLPQMAVLSTAEVPEDSLIRVTTVMGDTQTSAA